MASGATPATTAPDELALGFYVDSGFGDTLTPGSGWTSRVNVSNASDMELLAEDQTEASAGATPNASVGTGANTVWQVATMVLKERLTDGRGKLPRWRARAGIHRRHVRGQPPPRHALSAS